MILTIRPATMLDAKWLGHHLREEDRQEVETISGMAACVAVPESFATSRQCFTVRRPDPSGRVERDPCAIFGVVDDPREVGVGVVWLLGTDRIRTAVLSILREALFWRDEWLRLYPNGVHNVVDKRNSLHLRWLQLLGFTLMQEVEYNGHTFVHAVLRNPQ